jgi:hypothetical protein
MCRLFFGNNGKLDYLEGYIEDITERKNTERDLIKFTRAVEQNISSIVLSECKKAEEELIDDKEAPKKLTASKRLFLPILATNYVHLSMQLLAFLN